MKFSGLILVLLLVFGTGCGGFAARRMVQAPNTYPRWLAPEAPVTLAFSEQILTAFTNHYLHIPSPKARLAYQVIPPANYDFRWTNHTEEAEGKFDLSFTANVSSLAKRTNQWTASPRGTVVLLHGYGDSGLAMLPWGLLLADHGWRCVLVDLRGHGQSNGKQIYFGVQEVHDLTILLDRLAQHHDVDPPVSVLGHSFGAVLALRWKMADLRIDKVVAISPYADLSKAVLGLADQYAGWLPQSFIKAGLRKLPGLLQVTPCELNPSCWLETGPDTALFIAGTADRIASSAQVEQLHQLAGPGNELLVVPDAAHEPLPFYLDDLAEPVLHWLSANPTAPAAN